MTNWTLDTPSKRSWFLVMLLGIGLAVGSYALYEFNDHYYDYWHLITNGRRGYGAYRQSFFLGVVLAGAGLSMSYLREWTWDRISSWIRHGSPPAASSKLAEPQTPPSQPAARTVVDGFDVREEAEKFFEASSLVRDGQPRVVILMGGVASGKTMMRRQNYASGFVVVDAAEVFLNLSKGAFYPFPDHFQNPMSLIGRVVAATAVMERRNIVTEIIGSEYAPTMKLIEAMKSIGYKVEVVGVTCDVAETAVRNENREDNAISAYYAERFNRAWLLEAVARNPPKT